jgi:hypothetical protein
MNTAPTLKVTFVRVERKCLYNESARTKGQPLIIDFNVLINGEHRATFVKWDRNSRRYTLSYVDDHRDIKLKTRPSQPDSYEDVATAPSQKDFLAIVNKALAQNRLPTLAQIAEKIAKDRQEAVAEAIKREQNVVASINTQMLNAAAPQLYSTLNLIAKSDDFNGDTFIKELQTLAKEALAKAGPLVSITPTKVITSEEAERRDLRVLGEGEHEYHVTLWGDSAPKVQIGIKAMSQVQAEKAALDWGRNSWWNDQRKIGIQTVELVVP